MHNSITEPRQQATIMPFVKSEQWQKSVHTRKPIPLHPYQWEDHPVFNNLAICVVSITVSQFSLEYFNRWDDFF